MKTAVDGSQAGPHKTERAPWRETGLLMKPSSKNEPVVHEREVIVPLDPAHEDKPTLVERERIEEKRVEKAENQLTIPKEKAVCPLTDEKENDPADEGDQSEEDEEGEREEIIR
jgi:hypothetical protein